MTDVSVFSQSYVQISASLTNVRGLRLTEHKRAIGLTEHKRATKNGDVNNHIRGGE